MSNKIDLSKITSKLASGNVEELKRLQSRINNDGNKYVELTDWDFSFRKDDNSLISIFSLKPKVAGSVINCVLSGMSTGNTVLSSGLSSQLSNLSTDGDGAYTGWSFCNFTPFGSVKIDGEISGTVQLPNGMDYTFVFKDSITVGGNAK